MASAYRYVICLYVVSNQNLLSGIGLSLRTVMPAYFLSFVYTVQLRGVSETPFLSLDMFCIVDRLYGTLDKKIRSWLRTKQENSGFGFGIGSNKVVLQDLLKDQLLVAYDLAGALDYLHAHQ